jgi:hypothetical protein
MSKKKPRFSGHQTFAFRYGWLEKGFKFARENKNFGDENAIVDLGVGKNMVDSIKYWCEMTGILSNGSATDFGCCLLDEKKGWDPFLEDNASLWLLHWKMNTNQEFFTAGSVAFSFLHKPEFSKRDVVEAISRYFDQEGKKGPSDGVILRDIDCYIRSYAGARRFEKKKNGEESFNCPLQELSLIHPMNDAEMYRFSIGPKLSLPPEIIGYAIWDYLNRNQSRNSLRIQEALYHEYSPGQLFMLDENSLIEAINTLNSNPKWESKFSFVESAGIALIHCSLQSGNDLLEHYYNKGRA